MSDYKFNTLFFAIAIIFLINLFGPATAVSVTLDSDDTIAVCNIPADRSLSAFSIQLYYGNDVYIDDVSPISPFMVVASIQNNDGTTIIGGISGGCDALSGNVKVAHIEREGKGLIAINVLEISDQKGEPIFPFPGSNLTLTVNNSSGLIGEHTNVLLFVNNAVNLGSIGITIEYDNSALRIEEVSKWPPLPISNFSSAIGEKNVSFFFIHPKGYSGSGPIAVINCTLLEIGTYPIIITDAIANDASNLSEIPLIRENGFISVSSVLPPEGAFVFNTSVGVVPFSVQFIDQTKNNPETWLWDFGDGDTSTLQNPIHQYSAPGNYTVSLTVANAGGKDSLVKKCAVIALPVLFGDANDDCAVNQADVLRVLREVVGLEQCPSHASNIFLQTDVHRNGKIEVGDAMYIAQHNVGLRNCWFEPCVS